MHLKTAPGLPNTPAGRLTVMFFATSGSPGFSRRSRVTSSGWPPARGLEVPTSNSVTFTLAGAATAKAPIEMIARTNATAPRTARRAAPALVSVLCVLILIVSLLII